jgi:hypothetical protein
MGKLFLLILVLSVAGVCYVWGSKHERQVRYWGEEAVYQLDQARAATLGRLEQHKWGR